MPTISDVAKRAGVSIKTVSRVINHEPYVRDHTRTRVLAAMEELGFAANVSAQRLASGRAHAIGFIFHNPSWQYIQTALQGVLAVSRAAGYELVLYPCDIDRPSDCRRILDLTTQRKVDGLVFTPPCDVVSQVLDDLRAADIPFVRMTPGDRGEDRPWTAADDLGGACAMTQHLLQLGHRQIGFITGSQVQVASAHRQAGYQKALESCGIQVNPALIAPGDFDFASGAAAARTLLAAAPRPTAIFASNDDMAAGALSAAHAAGLRIPEDLSIGGFDDSPLSWQVWPALTTVHQPIYEIAARATELLVAMLRGETLAAAHHILPTRLIVRESTGRPTPPTGAD